MHGLISRAPDWRLETRVQVSTALCPREGRSLKETRPGARSTCRTPRREPLGRGVVTQHVFKFWVFSAPSVPPHLNPMRGSLASQPNTLIPSELPCSKTVPMHVVTLRWLSAAAGPDPPP